MDHEQFFSKVMENLTPADGMPLMREYVSKHFSVPVHDFEAVLNSSTRKSISDYGKRAYANGKLNVNEPADVHAALEEFLHRNNLEG